MARIPRIAHFVFGLRPQTEPFQLLHFLAIESCRRLIRPERIFLHYHELPMGAYWDAIRPWLTLRRVEMSREVHEAEYDESLVPEAYRYAHHADFVRLDALIEHGGVYADTDTLFLRAIPEELYEHPFVIGRESEVADELTGERKASLCNALMMAEPGARFAVEWRDRMGAALNGTWSNHSCLLAQRISEELPEQVHIEPESSFFPYPCSREGLTALLDEGGVDTTASYSVHLWEHVWGAFERTDFSSHHAGEYTADGLRRSSGPIGSFARPFLPDLEVDDVPR